MISDGIYMVSGILFIVLVGEVVRNKKLRCDFFDLRSMTETLFFVPLNSVCWHRHLI